MHLTIEITTKLSADVAGELILTYINDQQRWGYHTRDFVRGGFYEVDQLSPLEVRTICCGCYANTPGIGDDVAWWRSDDLGLDIFLRWDGDGTIVLRHADWMLENSDCKKDYGWEWVTDKHWILTAVRNAGDYYQDEPSALSAKASTP